MPKKREKVKRQPTKRQLSHWEKEKKRQRIIFIAGISLIVVALGLIIGGWLYYQYLPLQQVVIKVNDRAFKMNYFIDMLEYAGGANASPEDVARSIKQYELVRKDAAALGVTVSKEEIDKEMNKKSPPVSSKYIDAVRAQLLLGKMRDEHFEEQVPLSTAQRHVMAMLLESESQAKNVKKRLDDNEDFGTLAEELSLNIFSQANKGDMGWRPEGILGMALGSQKLEQYAFTADAGYVSEPIYDDSQTKTVGYWLVKVTEKMPDTKEAKIYAILLGNEEEAQKAKTRLDNGEDFHALAKELSLHEESKNAGEGGLMGIVNADNITKAIADYAFEENTELNKVSDILKDTTVSTPGGYWLIKVAEISDDRELDEENREILKNQLLSDWINGLWTSPNYVVEDFLTDKNKEFAQQQVARNAKK